jgi:hypothetical protein
MANMISYINRTKDNKKLDGFRIHLVKTNVYCLCVPIDVSVDINSNVLNAFNIKWFIYKHRT